MRIWSSSWPSSSSSPWLLRRRRPWQSVRPGPDCQYRCRPVAGQSWREHVARAHEYPHHPGGPGLVSGVVRTPGDEPRIAGSRDGVGPPAGGAGPSRCAVMLPDEARRPPRHQHRCPWRALLRSCATSSAALLVTLSASLGRVPCALRRMRRASMRAEVLAEVANGCGAVTGLLLTWLEVEVHRGPHSFRRRPRQQKP